MFDECLKESLMNSVEYVKEVDTVRHSALGKLVWEVEHKDRVFTHVLCHMAHTQLVIVGYMDSLDLAQFEQLLLTTQNQLQEVLVNPKHKNELSEM